MIETVLPFISRVLNGRVVETLKDYAVKALVNTVDHLGSITYKVNDFIDEKVDEVAETELRVSCIEQVKIYKSLTLDSLSDLIDSSSFGRYRG